MTLWVGVGWLLEPVPTHKALTLTQQQQQKTHVLTFIEDVKAINLSAGFPNVTVCVYHEPPPDVVPM